MTSPLKDEVHDKQRKGTDGKTSQQPNTDNRHGSDGEHNGQHDITRPAIANKDKLLQPSLERTSTSSGNGSAFKSQEKLPGDFPHVIVPNAGRPATDSSRLAGPKVKPPVSTEHEQVELDYGEQLPKQVQSLSLNQARTTLGAIRGDSRARGYNPQERVLGYGTEPNNPNNPFVHPDALYNPNPQTIDLLQLRQARQQSQGRQSSLNDPSSLESLVNREEALRTDPFGIRRLQGVSDSQLRQQEKEAAIGFTLANATPEQRRQYEQRQAIEQRHLQDPDLRQPASLQVRLRLPEEQLTLEQQRVYGQQQELQAALRTGDMIAHHIDQLQVEYTRNDWQEDSHWYGLDDKKFLQDVQSRNLYHVSDYDKFRVLSTIERIKTQNPDIFATKELSKLTPQQRQLREMIDGKINESTGKREPGLQDNVRTQLVQRLRHEVTKLDIALVNQQSKQGLVSNAADAVIGHMGKPGGWAGMFMDSDATSQSTRENLEKARQASQNILALSDFKGNNLEFAKAYQTRVRELGQSLQQTGENLNKMANAHQGRIEGVSDIAQITAALSVTLACASAAPETFGGSLAVIPIVAPMAAGAAGKVVTKLLESETTATGKAYTAPDILEDTVIAALTSAPFLPGNRIAKPLLQAESTIAKQVAATEGKQLVIQVTTASIEQTAKTAGTELTVQAASKPLIQQVRQTGANLAKQFGELTPKTAAELTVKYTAQAGKRTTGYALAGGIDGATIQGTRAVIKGEDPLKASVQGFAGGAILGPIMGPAIKYGGALAKKGVDWLRTNAVREITAQVPAARDAVIKANTTYTTAQLNQPGINIENTVEFAQLSSTTRPGFNTNSNYIGQDPIIIGAGHKPPLAQPATSIEPEPSVGMEHPADNTRIIPLPGRQVLHMTPDPENPEGHFLSGAHAETAKPETNFEQHMEKLRAEGRQLGKDRSQLRKEISSEDGDSTELGNLQEKIDKNNSEVSGNLEQRMELLKHRIEQIYQEWKEPIAKLELRRDQLNNNINTDLNFLYSYAKENIAGCPPQIAELLKEPLGPCKTRKQLTDRLEAATNMMRNHIAELPDIMTNTIRGLDALYTSRQQVIEQLKANGKAMRERGAQQEILNLQRDYRTLQIALAAEQGKLAPTNQFPLIWDYRTDHLSVPTKKHWDFRSSQAQQDSSPYRWNFCNQASGLPIHVIGDSVAYDDITNVLEAAGRLPRGSNTPFQFRIAKEGSAASYDDLTGTIHMDVHPDTPKDLLQHISRHEVGHAVHRDYFEYLPEAQQKPVMDAYCKWLKSPEVIERLGVDPLSDYVGSFAKREAVYGSVNPSAYLACFPEICAEMRALHEFSKTKSGEGLTYQELLKAVTTKFAPERGEMMSNADELYSAFKQYVFGPYDKNAKAGFPLVAKPPGTKQYK